MEGLIDGKAITKGYTLRTLCSYFLASPRAVTCTPQGIMRMFNEIGYDLSGKETVVT